MAGESFKRHAKRIEGIKSEVLRDRARAVLVGAEVIATRAKEIIREKGHVVTGALARDINSQLGSVSLFSVDAKIGTSLVYGPSVERLPEGARKMPVSYFSRGKLVKKPGRGEGGGFLLPAAIEKTPEALVAAGNILDQAMRRGSKK